jgi:hypothetical protein
MANINLKKQKMKPTIKKFTKKKRNVIYKKLIETLRVKVGDDYFICWKLAEYITGDFNDFGNPVDYECIYKIFPEWKEGYYKTIHDKKGWKHTLSFRKYALKIAIKLSEE